MCSFICMSHIYSLLYIYTSTRLSPSKICGLWGPSSGAYEQVTELKYVGEGGATGSPTHDGHRLICFWSNISLQSSLFWGFYNLGHKRLYGYGSIPINTIFRGMNIHLPAILMFTRGTRFWHTAISFITFIELELCPTHQGRAEKSARKNPRCMVRHLGFVHT